MQSDLGCDVCRERAYSVGLPFVGLSRTGKVIVRRCATCATYWLETERLAYPVTDEEAESTAPDVLRSA